MRPLLRVARRAGKRQVRCAVGTACRLGLDVLHLQGHLLRATVGTRPVPLFQQILLELVAEQGALLIVHTRYFRVLSLLQVEADQLLGECCDMATLPDPRHPGEYVG